MANKKLWTRKVIKEIENKLQTRFYCLFYNDKIMFNIIDEVLTISKDGKIDWSERDPRGGIIEEIPEAKRKVLEGILIKHGIIKGGK